MLLPRLEQVELPQVPPAHDLVLQRGGGRLLPQLFGREVHLLTGDAPQDLGVRREGGGGRCQRVGLRAGGESSCAVVQGGGCSLR